MNVIVLALVLQSSLVLPPRTAVENPATVSTIPKKLLKDYGKIWARFISGKEDAKLKKDLDRLLQKQNALDSAWIVEGYLALYGGDDTTAQAKFTQALTANPNNPIAVFYLAELAQAHGQYARAASLYAQLLSMDASLPDIETKRQRALLLATDSLVRAAARAENENRLAEAEDYYREALTIAPNEPTLRVRLADLLSKENKNDEAESERKAGEDLAPHYASKSPADDVKQTEDLEDLGRWGSEIDVFRQVRAVEIVTREQLALLMLRYFPEVAELPHTSQIIIDIEDSRARSEIQTAVAVGLLDPRPNHEFQPAASVTRGDFAKALARLSRLIGLSGPQSSSTHLDLAPTNALYSDVQLVIGFGLMTLRESGSFDVNGDVSGREAVNAVERLLRSFQQVKR